MFGGPDFFQPADGRCRQSAGAAADECGEGLGEIARRDAVWVQDGDQHLETFRAARVGRQNWRRELDAFGSLRTPVADTWLTHADVADAGSNLALG